MRPYPQTRPTTANFPNFGLITPPKRPSTLTKLVELTTIPPKTTINNQMEVSYVFQSLNTILLDYNTQLNTKNPIGLHFECDIIDCNPGIFKQFIERTIKPNELLS